MSALTEAERAEVEHELAVLRESEERLYDSEPVSHDAAARRGETLGRLLAEIARLRALLSDEAPYPESPLASRKAPS